MVWTQELIDQLKALNARRLSCAEVAKRLNISRSAVIGKLHRLGICQTMEQVKVARAHKRELKQANKPPRPDRFVAGSRFPTCSPIDPDSGMLPTERVIDLPVEVPAVGVPLFALEPEHCRWPIGNPKEADFVFCGAAMRDGSYCSHHARIAHR